MRWVNWHFGRRGATALLLASALLLPPAISSAAVFVSVNFAPPPIPVYVQPIAPGPDYMWIPGYWAYGPNGYYWVPGTWVLAPYVGALWTPGYWAWTGAVYTWHPGYWGPRVGYYGGINYGFGYFGVGYYGGYWNAGHFVYNTAVTRVDVTRVHNTYNRTVIQNDVRVSYNGGPGGVVHAATSEERLAERDAHQRATAVQLRHERTASTNREQFASVNRGAPTMSARPIPYGHLSPEDRPGRVTNRPQPGQVEAYRGNPAARQIHTNEGSAPGGAPPQHAGRGGAEGGRHEGGEHAGHPQR
jgi:hypothetical protein